MSIWSMMLSMMLSINLIDLPASPINCRPKWNQSDAHFVPWSDRKHTRFLGVVVFSVSLFILAAGSVIHVAERRTIKNGRSSRKWPVRHRKGSTYTGRPEKKKTERHTGKKQPEMGFFLAAEILAGNQKISLPRKQNRNFLS